MAEGIVSFVLDKLSNAVVNEVLLIHGVGEQVEKLSDELSWIKYFLKDADMKQIVNEREKLWVEKVRDVAYDIEDVIDNAFFLKVPETGTTSKELPKGCAPIVGAAKWMWRKPKKLPALHSLAVEMNQILARIEQINEDRVNYGINTLGEGSQERLRLPIRPPVLHQIDDPDVVGFDSDRENVVNQLLDTSNKRRAVISIVGPGGLGKTTLARKVYNSNDVKRHFDVRIWVVISQEYNLIHILRKIIKQIEPLPRIDPEDEEGYLLTKLYKTLNGEKYTVEDYLRPSSRKPDADEEPQPKKYLLVLDDMWKRDLWTQIGRVLPDAGIGSRVIVTTRIQNVVDNAEPYKLSYLTEEASLELLFKKALPNRDLIEGYPDELDEVGKQFVKKCGGLPFALSVLGGLLSKKNPSYISWSNMLQTMNWSIEGRECIEIMETSYDDLPLVLKTCFMYFAAFPEDYEIKAKKLLRLWVAEGFIPAEESRTFENTAESFLEDLVQRSLVQVSKRSSYDDSIRSCRIHDLLRELAIKKAKEDNLLTICSKPDNSESSTKARRVAVDYSGCDELMEHANPNLRSLLCFKNPIPNCSRQRLLKVLSYMAGSRSELVDFECFHGLHQLRYCELNGRLSSNRRSFESFIGSLKFVETLDFSELEDHSDLPSDIWNVKTLRHVMLNYMEYTAGPSSSADLKNLQTLRCVKSRESWNAQLPKLPNLRDLDIKVESSFSWDLFAKLLGTLNHLTYLQLKGNEVPQSIVEMQRFPFHRDLQSLILEEQSPSPNKKLLPKVGMFPIYITELTLRGLQFKEDPVPVLEKLCSLRVLKLGGENVNRKMSCSNEGFQQLHELEFSSLRNLEEWEITAGAMPIIKVVRISFCHKLKVPLGLQYLSNLKKLSVERCSILLLDAYEIRNYVCKHVPDIYMFPTNYDRENIVNHLLDTRTKRRAVISIVGPGGLGKTTLAREVYNSNDVKRWFDVCIWVTISQEFKLMDILRKILERVEALHQNDLEGGEAYLLTKLSKTLNGEKYTIENHLRPNSHDPQSSEKPQPKRYLLVLDDMWRSDLWIKLGEVLPDAGIGSRVIVTTRIQNIIDDAEPYKLSYSKEQSLELLLGKALPNRDLSKGFPDELYEIGNQFVKKCGGLPLALLVLGGLLSKKPANYVTWSNMLQTMNWSIKGRECTEIMETSYDDLPLVLKTCFMYFAAFPEDYEINTGRLFQLWVAEGFIPEEESRTLEDTAESFLEDLVERSLVQVSKRSHADSIISCRIHDLLRELAVQKAKEDNFLTICSNPTNWESSAKAHRVAVHYSGCNKLMEHANPNLCSLLSFEKPMPNCSRQRLLKVLSDMAGWRSELVDFEYFHRLNQLRYCQLSGRLSSNRRSFESFISNLKFVETLAFSGLQEHGDLPDDVWNVKTLRHVILNGDYTSGPSSSADLRNLQTLVCVKSRESWNAQLPKLPNLRHLVITVESSFSWDVMAKLLDTLNHLTTIDLCGSEVPQTIVEMQRFPFYQHLQSLLLTELSSFPNKKLSPEVGMFPIHITKLRLDNLQFMEDPLPVLEKLRSLRELWLGGEEVNRKMRCSDGGFQQLRELMFYHLTNLREWEIKAGAMPILKEVTLWDCNKLRVPLGLQYLSNLKQLDINGCSELNEHKDEIRNNICKHVPHISWSK